MKLLDIIREQVILNENIAQAEKILKELGIPLDDPQYINLKTTLEKNGKSTLNSIEHSLYQYASK